jgi:hypothetical protein
MHTHTYSLAWGGCCGQAASGENLRRTATAEFCLFFSFVGPAEQQHGANCKPFLFSSK